MITRAGFGSVLVSILLVSILQKMDGDTDANDVEGLRVFYKSLNSPLQLTGWNDPEGGDDPCGDFWKGITCDNDGVNVTQIELPGLGLNGTLGWTSSLNKLEHLTVLDLSNNQLEGMIPYNLPVNIELLNLQRNHLQKNIPWSLGQSVSLTELRLAHNNLTGLIQDTFSMLHSLITLDLSDNNFTGSIPGSFVNLSKLSFLYLQENEIDSGLEILTTLRSLHTLDIRNNAFDGKEIPIQLMAIPSFQFSGSEFNSSLPWDQLNASVPQNQFNQSVGHSPTRAPTPAAHDHPSTTHPPRNNSHTKSPPPELSEHHKTTSSSPAAAPGPSLAQAMANIADVIGEEGREGVSFWTRDRIAGVSVAAILAAVAGVLTFFYFKWKDLEEEKKDESEEMSWLELGSLNTCPRQAKNW